MIALLCGLGCDCSVLVGAGGVTGEVDDGFGIAKVATGVWVGGSAVSDGWMVGKDCTLVGEIMTWAVGGREVAKGVELGRQAAITSTETKPDTISRFIIATPVS
jgi:hypothetical protein